MNQFMNLLRAVKINYSRSNRKLNSASPSKLLKKSGFNNPSINMSFSVSKVLYTSNSESNNKYISKSKAGQK